MPTLHCLHPLVTLSGSPFVAASQCLRLVPPPILAVPSSLPRGLPPVANMLSLHCAHRNRAHTPSRRPFVFASRLAVKWLLLLRPPCLRRWAAPNRSVNRPPTAWRLGRATALVHHRPHGQGTMPLSAGYLCVRLHKASIARAPHGHPSLRTARSQQHPSTLERRRLRTVARTAIGVCCAGVGLIRPRH